MMIRLIVLAVVVVSFSFFRFNSEEEPDCIRKVNLKLVKGDIITGAVLNEEWCFAQTLNNKELW